MPVPAIFILTGAFDDRYLVTREDDPVVCTSAGKRLILHRAIQESAQCSITLLSPHPRGRKAPRPLTEQESTFGASRQVFSKASARRKVRYVLDIINYAKHVYKHTSDGAVLIVDNYELIYVMACWYCRLRGRSNRIILEYEDGKHAIDKGLWRVFSGLAEFLGRPLVEAAILATPTLGARLPIDIPKVTVPGILRSDLRFNPLPQAGAPINVLYSGSLDYERGTPLLLDYLRSDSICEDAVFHITGQGHFQDELQALCQRRKGVVHYHGCVSDAELAAIRSRCHFGLNLQSSSNPISEVTYPSKTFDYMNAGIRVISTRAAGIEDVLGDSAIYLDQETVAGLAKAIRVAAEQAANSSTTGLQAMDRYTFDGTVSRLRDLLKRGQFISGLA